MIEIDPKIEEKVILVGICPQGQSIEKIEEYLDELAFLAETAGGITVKSFIQKMERPDHSFFVGSGKVKEIKEAADFYDASTTGRARADAIPSAKIERAMDTP